ncbi:hypothetical protein GJ496_001285 [Pomphorhynchus laevis]|nr:hypothetical protein GJ496_001285 [Pomphorhynchus laevis]
MLPKTLGLCALYFVICFLSASMAIPDNYQRSAERYSNRNQLFIEDCECGRDRTPKTCDTRRCRKKFKTDQTFMKQMDQMIYDAISALKIKHLQKKKVAPKQVSKISTERIEKIRIQEKAGENVKVSTELKSDENISKESEKTETPAITDVKETEKVSEEVKVDTELKPVEDIKTESENVVSRDEAGSEEKKKDIEDDETVDEVKVSTELNADEDISKESEKQETTEITDAKETEKVTEEGKSETELKPAKNIKIESATFVGTSRNRIQHKY